MIDGWEWIRITHGYQPRSVSLMYRMPAANWKT